jgi:glycosyltransferase involved in cell wall biosynthesis
MRIYYDGAIYNDYSIRPGGISNFFDHLISRVAEHHDCLLTSFRPKTKPHPSGSRLTLSHFDLPFTHGRIRKKLHNIHSYCAVNLFKPNLIHPTYYTRAFPLPKNTRLIYTVYDMIHEKWNEELDQDGAASRLKLNCLDRADAIVCISESTRNDLLSYCPHFAEKTSVIYLAGELKGDPIGHRQNILQHHAEIPYFLYVGARHSYKNFTRLVIAFSQLRKSGFQFQLVVVGSPFDRDETSLFVNLGVHNYIKIFSDATDVQLYGLYSGAFALVYPSLYEGFGIPPLEAMALNTPVLASNTSSIPEVVGNAALLFNPWSIESILDSMKYLAQNASLRDDLVHKGKQRIAKFTWNKTAAQYIELYSNLTASDTVV